MIMEQTINITITIILTLILLQLFLFILQLIIFKINGIINDIKGVDCKESISLFILESYNIEDGNNFSFINIIITSFLVFFNFVYLGLHIYKLLFW